MERKATAIWEKSLKEGYGSLTTESGALTDARYSFGTRFANNPGTNPEELIAAAHAGCFSMALSGQLTKAGYPPKSIQTDAMVTIEQTGNEWTVTRIHLNVMADVPGASKESFERAANAAKEGCPISRLLNAKISMEVRLEGAKVEAA